MKRSISESLVEKRLRLSHWECPLHLRPLTLVLVFPFAPLSWALPPDVAPAFQSGVGWSASGFRAWLVADARPVLAVERPVPDPSGPV